MYQNIYTNNYFFNFLSSFIFLSVSILFSYCISLKLSKKNISLLGEFQPILLFFLIFTFYSIALNILVLMNFYGFFKIVFFSIFFIQIAYVMINIKQFSDYNRPSTKISFKQKIIIIFCFLFFIISILPLSDADSIAVMQNAANSIYQNGLNNINLNRDIEFTSILNTEILLIISPILNSDNFGAQLNLFTLIFFITYKFKDKINFTLILFSSPLILYFISTAKLQLFFAILYLMLFVIINKNFIKNKYDLFVTIILIVFYTSGKISYMLIALPLYIFFIIKNLSAWKNIFFYSLIAFVVVLLPILITKHIYFGNFFAPFFDNLIGNSNELYNAYALSLRSSDGWLSNYSDYKLYLKPFIALDLRSISSSFGLIFLLMFFDLNLLKKVKFFPYVIIILIFLTGQILPRYYFEAFLILAYYFNSNNIVPRLLIVFQCSLILIIVLMYAYISYIKVGVILNKSTYMDKFSYSYYNAAQLKKLNLDGNILNISIDRQSIFLDENVYSNRNLSIKNLYNGNNSKNLGDFIKENSIKYMIINKSKKLYSCLELKKIGEINSQEAIRNFLITAVKSKESIYLIIDNKC